ncbi:hypothetical protein JOS77_10450 [Chromobacterium haemolyticum]|nr:hypothetical protein JOS77_10450 [Chromobacterium haemolyticum]
MASTLNESDHAKLPPAHFIDLIAVGDARLGQAGLQRARRRAFRPGRLAARQSGIGHQPSGRRNDETLLAELVRSTPEDARKLLETEGYFDARVNVREESPRQYVIEVKPGQPTLIDDVTIRLNGPIRDEGDFQQRFAAVLEAWSLPMGAPYRQSDWDGSKRAVMRLITADRFPRAQISKSVAEIDPATRRAQLLVVDIDSGPVILFGDITVKGMKRYPEKIATGLADFSPRHRLPAAENF